MPKTRYINIYIFLIWLKRIKYGSVFKKKSFIGFLGKKYIEIHISYMILAWFTLFTLFTWVLWGYWASHNILHPIKCATCFSLEARGSPSLCLTFFLVKTGIKTLFYFDLHWIIQICLQPLPHFYMLRFYHTFFWILMFFGTPQHLYLTNSISQ